MTHVLACVDGSAAASPLCDYAAWASSRLGAPLTLLHVLDHVRYPMEADLSGAIGLGSREYLLDELASLDERRGKIALEQGRLMLQAASERVVGNGVADPVIKQRHGDLVATLREMEEEIRLLVMGLHGEASSAPGHPIGSHLESAVRSIRRPILITPAEFQAPQSALLAFDGSATTRRSVELLVASPLLVGLPVHVLMVNRPSEEAASQLDWAVGQLQAAGFDVRRAHREGDVEPTLHAYQAEHRLDLLVMGAYGHSRIREFLLGSTTTKLLRTTTGPLLILR